MIERNSVTAVSMHPLSCAPLMIAAASGCSLARSKLAASCNSSCSENPLSAMIETNFGLPSVRVPVLSTTKVFTFSIISNTSAFLMSTPNCAPRPMPTMIDIGVANPSAHGQAIIKTATALTMACANLGSGPQIPHAASVVSAANITAGTK